MENLKSVDVIESSRIREKLKDICTKNGKTRNIKTPLGPVVVKHVACSPTSQSQARRINVGNDARPSPFPIRSFECRPSPNHRKISVTSPQGRSTCRGIIHARHRSPSLSHSRHTSPTSIPHQRRRTPSPANMFDPQQIEIIRKRLEKLPQVRFYFLRQPGPNSFLITAENTENKYKVVIGPQTCSCGKGPHCLHLLFVLVRVLQVQPTDLYIWNKTLKDYEVDTLLKRYHAKRKSLVSNSKIRMRKQNTVNQAIASSPVNTTNTTTPSFISSRNSEDEEEEEVEENKCVICLSEMYSDDRLFICKNGCRNKLHHHCISVWAEERRKQNENLECPLCRISLTFSSSDHQQNTKCTKSVESSFSNNASTTDLPSPEIHVSLPGIPASSIILIDRHLPLPNTDHPIPESYRESVQPWIEVFGSHMVSCFFSRDWAIRETALRRLTREVITVLLHDSEQDSRMSGAARRKVLQPDHHVRLPQNMPPGGIYNKSKETVLKCCSNILTLIATDPVYKVYIACLRCLRALLAYSSCRTDQDISFLQSLVRPILDTIILRCADANKRINLLSTATVLELCRGQGGALTVGNLARFPPRDGLGGVKFVLSSTLKSNRQEASWQWLLGRFSLITRIMGEFSEEFRLQYVPANTNSDSPKLKIVNDDRVMSVLKFSLDSVNHNHSTVSKMARHVFIQAAQICLYFPLIFSHVYDMLATLDSSLHMHLKKKILCVLQSNPTVVPASKNSSVEHSVFRRFSIDNSHEHEKSLVHSTLSNDVSRNANILSVNLHHRMQRSSSHSPGRVIKQSVNTRAPSGNKMSPSPTNNHVPRIFTQSRQTPSIPQKQLKRPTHLPLLNKTSNLLPSRYDTNSPTPLKAQTNDRPKLLKVNSPKHFPAQLFSPPSSSENSILIMSSAGNETECSGSNFIDAAPSSPLTGWIDSFRSEVRSPNTPSIVPILPTSPAKSQDEAAYEEEIDEVSLCVEKSILKTTNDSFPKIPGLSKEQISCEEDPAFIIHIHPEIDVEDQKTHGSEKRATYQQHLHWNKGPLLGTGAFSTCFQARDIKSGTLMAVKQAAFCRNSEEEQDKVMESITEEITMMAKLDHPNIVRILGATQQGEHFNMFFEWMSGGSVAGLLDKYGPFNECVVYNYTLQVLLGLSYLHDNQILHRDLKGANLLVDSTGRHLRIGDFGAAGKLASQTTVAGEFQGQLLGTIAFMAPEVLRGEDYGRSCDIWSVGCVIIEMVTSKPPWNANNISNHLALIFKIAGSAIPPPIPDHLSKPLKNLIWSCLMMKCDERPSAKQLLLDYKHVLT